MPRRVSAEEAVAEAIRVCAAVIDRTPLIGIDGFGASGKTSLAAAVASAVPDAQVVHVDDFSGPHVAEWAWARFRAQVLIPVLAGRPARYQMWDWDRDCGGEWVDVPSGRPLIVEGVSATRSEVCAPWDLTIWVEAPRDVRLRRAVARDGESMLPKWLNDWLPSEEAYVGREHPERRVDLIVNGS